MSEQEKEVLDRLAEMLADSIPVYFSDPVNQAKCNEWKKGKGQTA